MRSVRLLGRLGSPLLGPALLGCAPFPGYLLVLSRRAQCSPLLSSCSMYQSWCQSWSSFNVYASSVWSNDFPRICRNSIKARRWILYPYRYSCKMNNHSGPPTWHLGSVLGEIPAPLMPFNRVFWVIWLIDRVFWIINRVFKSTGWYFLLFHVLSVLHSGWQDDIMRC